MKEIRKISLPSLKDVSYNININNTKIIEQYSPFSIQSILELTKSINEKIMKKQNINSNKSLQDIDLTSCLQCSYIKKPSKFNISSNEKNEFKKKITAKSINGYKEVYPLPKITLKKNNCENKQTNNIKKFEYSPVRNNINEITDKNKCSNSLLALRQLYNNTIMNENDNNNKTINNRKIFKRNLKNINSFISNNDIKIYINESQNLDESLYITSKKNINTQTRNLCDLEYYHKNKKLVNFALYPLLREVEIIKKYHMTENIKKNNKIFNLFSNSTNKSDLINSSSLKPDVFHNTLFNNTNNNINTHNNNINTEEIVKIPEIKTQQNTINNFSNSIPKKIKENISLDRQFNNKKNNSNNKSVSLNIKTKSRNLRNTFRIKKTEKPKLFPITQLNTFHNTYNSQEYVSKKYFSKKIIPYQKFNLPPLIGGQTPEKFYYTINKMYRKQLKEYMKHRINWEYINTKSQFFLENKNININFQWKYYSNRLNFKNYKLENGVPSRKLKIVNVFERNFEVGNKRNMFINFITYCDKINLNAFQYVPLTITITNSNNIDNYLDSLKEIMTFVESKKNSKIDIISNRKYNEEFWYDKNFESINNQYIYIDKNYLSQKNYWILKPTDLYQGKCIEICNNFEEISKKCKNMFKGVDRRLLPELLINTEEEDSEDENNNLNLTINNNFESDNEVIKAENNLNNSLIINHYNNNLKPKKKKKNICRMYCSNEIIVQKYLDNPLLYNKRKFDIRCYVLVDNNLNVFFCREGHLKGSSELYNINNTSKFVHITNHSIQKKSSKFEQYEYGNEMSYTDFKNFMKQENISLDKFDNMIKQMKFLVKISFMSVGKKLMRTSPVLCFEIFGYDFILDNDFKPWILEINNNPGLGISSPLIEKLIPRMLDDAFRLTIDKIFDTKYSNDVIDKNGNYKSKYQLDGFNDEENVFEFLCNVG